MDLGEAMLLGVTEGLTEFLPVSSTGHLTVVEKLLGLRLDDPGVTAFTAIIQLGPILAVLIFFRRDIVALAGAWLRGIASPSRRGDQYRLAWAVVLGTVPIGVVGFLGRDAISAARSLWVVAAALVGWSLVMVVAERAGTQSRSESEIRWRDALVVGLVQCVALIPGVSRSGATISAGLLRGLDRVSATRFSFFLSIPAMIAAGVFEAASEGSAVSRTLGWAATGTGTLVAFVVGYAAIAWLLRLVARHPITVFVPYRIALGLLLAAALVTGLITP